MFDRIKVSRAIESFALDPNLHSRNQGFKFVSEKVSHHPPVMAFYAEAAKWKLGGHVAPSQKFWGRSMVSAMSCHAYEGAVIDAKGVVGNLYDG